MEMISIPTIEGGVISVPKDSLILRPSAYGIVFYQEKVLLVTIRSNGKYFFPGGGVAKGETVREAVAREVFEETGIEVEVGDLAYAKDCFFHYTPHNESWHSLLFFYRCVPKTLAITADYATLKDEAKAATWISLSEVGEDDVMPNAREALAIIKGKN